MNSVIEGEGYFALFLCKLYGCVYNKINWFINTLWHCIWIIKLREIMTICKRKGITIFICLLLGKLLLIKQKSGCRKWIFIYIHDVQQKKTSRILINKKRI